MSKMSELDQWMQEMGIEGMDIEELFVLDEWPIEEVDMDVPTREEIDCETNDSGEVN